MESEGWTVKDCTTCRHAEYDCYEYYGTTAKCWFVSGCKLDNDTEVDSCEEYEEYQEPVDIWHDDV